MPKSTAAGLLAPESSEGREAAAGRTWGPQAWLLGGPRLRPKGWRHGRISGSRILGVPPLLLPLPRLLSQRRVIRGGPPLQELDWELFVLGQPGGACHQWQWGESAVKAANSGRLPLPHLLIEIRILLQLELPGELSVGQPPPRRLRAELHVAAVFLLRKLSVRRRPTVSCPRAARRCVPPKDAGRA